MIKLLNILAILFLLLQSCKGQEIIGEIEPGAEQTEDYFPLLKGKKIALIANHTSTIKGKHILDSLINAGIKVTKIFTPEHGFRGAEEAGFLIDNSKDAATSIPIISLYGKNKKPCKKDMQNIDIALFDLQDVGVRFYTYISTLAYLMEACAENNVDLILLDRPNPNGFYVDGPILEPDNYSFVGMHPIPIVYGLTIGEFGKMINEEKWLKDSLKCNLIIIKNKNYTHSKLYNLPIKPSPNLNTMESIYLYPSVCLFEGTIMSVGRGTEKPFTIFGHPEMNCGNYVFTPTNLLSKAQNPLYYNIKCRGFNIINFADTIINNCKINLSWLINAYKEMGSNKSFFNNYFAKLAGRKLQKQIEENVTEMEIRKSWSEDIKKYKIIRVKYLLYPDF